MDSIPIINCSVISSKNSSNVNLAKLAEEFGDAMSSIGFCYLINHGVNSVAVEKVFKLSKEFFTLPISEKTKYKKDNPAENFHGYGGLDDEVHQSENSVELKEYFDIWGSDAHDSNRFPPQVPEFKKSFDELRIDCNFLTLKLLKMLGIYLKLENPNLFAENHTCLQDSAVCSQTQFRTIYYFPIKDLKMEQKSGNPTRCGEHSDWGTLTLLFQDQIGGLEIKRMDGSWNEAKPLQNSILINSGQLLEIWSNGVFPATPHRVRLLKNEAEEKGEKFANANGRQSVIYFVSPDGETRVSPILPTMACKDNEEKRKYKEVIAYEYYKKLIQQTGANY